MPGLFDALETDAIARQERQAIADSVKQPVRYLVMSPFHDPFNGGSAVYADVFKIAHENPGTSRCLFPRRARRAGRSSL